MHDYIYQQLAADRAVTLRAEATAQRVGKQALARRAERKARKESRRAHRTARPTH
ncbi:MULTISPECIES: hypothetical protein [Thermocrispum]|jgi:hypothetical protein|uniref:Uncharacterized protein n=1 Tax=Thermocrispum agreste TaxID=37925 RepID=A0ABD6F9T7_9PSEU|nr:MULTISPECIES: hypothetical protein [Thermocrispum]